MRTLKSPSWRSKNRRLLFLSVLNFVEVFDSQHVFSAGRCTLSINSLTFRILFLIQNLDLEYKSNYRWETSGSIK